MSVKKINPRLIVLLVIMIVIAAIRVPNAAGVTPWAHFTAIGAMGLFGGAYFSNTWKAIALSLLTLLVSDLIINTIVHHGKYGIMYSGWYWVYLVFIIITLLGKWMIKTITVKNILVAAVLATLIHWLLLDCIVWLGSGVDIRTGLPLSRNLAGLWQCYMQGLSFAKYFLAGTLAYSAVMFRTFEWLGRRLPAEHRNRESIYID